MKNVEKWEKFNEQYVDDGYDYEGRGFTEPITLDVIRKHIISAYEEAEWEDFDINDPGVQKDINILAKRILFGFWEKLSYMAEDGALEEIAMREFK